jgi:hypothetical protein
VLDPIVVIIVGDVGKRVTLYGCDAGKDLSSRFDRVIDFIKVIQLLPNQSKTPPSPINPPALNMRFK